MADWPRRYHPVTDGVIDTTTTVQVYPHEPGRTDALIGWCGDGTYETFLNGAPVVVLHSSRPIPERIVGLGDVVVRRDRDDLRACPGGELGTRYFPADLVGPPPVH